jgi:hypothetical protein
MRAAAAITSITMKGGTSLRAEGAINRLAASNIVQPLDASREPRAPLSPHFCAQSAPQRARKSGVIATALTVLECANRLREKWQAEPT